MANSAGKVTGGDQSKTDTNRGSSMTFPFTKGGRKTNRVGSPSGTPNSNTVDGNARKASDPRYA
jgi:hypothetical protein